MKNKLGITIVVATIVAGFITQVILPVQVNAAAWTDAQVTGSNIDEPPYPFDCTVMQVNVGGINGTPQNVCAYEASNWRYAVSATYIQDGPNSGHSEYTLLISTPGDSAMYKVRGLPTSFTPVYTPHSDNIIFGDNSVYSPTGIPLFGIKNLLSKVTPTTIDGLPGYQLQSGAIEKLLQDENGQSINIGYAASSVNGRWLVAIVKSGGLIRVNTQTFEKKWVWKDAIDYSDPALRAIALIISDDGQYIGRSLYGAYRENNPYHPYMMHITSNCGMDITTFHTDWFGNPSSFNLPACPEKDFLPILTTAMGGPAAMVVLMGFSSDSNELYALTVKTSVDENGNTVIGNNQWISLHGSDFLPPMPFNYLALGDSYSSGEGDTQTQASGAKYYRNFTDNEENKSANQPREKCHTSSRSYPYKLAEDMRLDRNNGDQWDSVACSGATAWDVKEQGSQDYKGQNKGASKPWSTDGSKPRLEDYDVASLKTTALNEMIPGRQKQIEFVKRYKPQAITLTMGGNDVDFGGKISSCIMPYQCPIATEQGRKDLGKQLQGQFNNLISLYDELHEVSPVTKIYVLNYPQVINGTANGANCAVDSLGFMDDSERHVTSEGYAFINRVIKAATEYSGVKYIDVEHALDNHRLCDGILNERYATGIAALGSSERQESFHPNAKGNQAIASAVNQVLKVGDTQYDLLTYPYTLSPDHTVTAPTPAPTDYLAWDTNDAKKVETKQLTASTSVQKGSPFQIAIDLYNLAAGSIAKLVLHSDTVDLGSYTVNADGSLNATITIPNDVPAGYHTLILTGETYSGEPIQYEQVVFVHGSDLNDIDENGVPDSQQPCGPFLVASGNDRDHDGIDDACDPEPDHANPVVTPPADPYRIRAGNPTKTYAGQAEKPNALYIERNVAASSQTGVSGDNDADSDGWVTIATNQTTNTSQPPLIPYARFWVDGSDGHKVPHVSFRTPDNGCVQYKPTDISPVTSANTARIFAVEATDTNTCRQDSAAADADHDGQPDNTQPLYLVRNGNTNTTHMKPDGTTLHEDPTKLYLFRSTGAAEAQLGKSDYAVNESTPQGGIAVTDTTDYREKWTLLATSSAGAYATSYNLAKIKFINNYPYVLAGLTTTFYSQCTTYKPESAATIGKTTQYTRQLQLDWLTGFNITLQGGCNG